MVKTDFTIFLNKIAMGMVKNHPLTVWLNGRKQTALQTVETLNPVQEDQLQQWFIYQLRNAKTWGNA